MEIVFDKGVDAVQDTIYFYLIKLSQSIEKILCENKENQELLQILNENVELLTKRLSEEIKFTIECLTRKSINDIKYTKIMAHLTLLNKSRPFLTEKNLCLLNKTFETFEKNKSSLNCFLNAYN